MARKSEANKSRDATPIAEVPNFVIEARPTRIPPALEQLADDARVTYGAGIKHWRLHSATTAGQLREQITKTIKRQGEGHFTLDEAAQILTDAGGVGEHLSELLQGWADGDLPVHKGGSRYLRRPGETVCSFDDTVTVHDLDNWLLKHQKTGHAFPASTDSAGGGGQTVGAVSGEAKNGTIRRWSPEALAELKRDREQFGTKEAARRAGISGSRLRKLLPRELKLPQPHNLFTKK